MGERATGWEGVRANKTSINDKPPLAALSLRSQSLKGRFGIQHHGKGGTVRFRNLRVRALK